MASQPPESSVARHVGAIALAWALFVGGWLVLGALGRSTTPLWFSGLGPVAAWLAVAGVIPALSRGRAPTRAMVVAAAALTAVGLVASVHWESSIAAWTTAIGWDVLTCAASRRINGGRAAAFAPGCIRRVRALADTASWPALGARWAMLPMMAALAVQSDWCAGIGLSAGQGVALHLAAMLAPVALLRGLRLLRLKQPPFSPLWIAAFMAAGVAALPMWPGVRGWMTMSLLHAVAWGVAWSQDIAAVPRTASRRWTSVWHALVPAAVVLALGTAIAEFGLEGLVAVHIGLGVLSLAGAVAWIVSDAWHHEYPQQKETLA
jgi:hypothetical protein